MKELFGFEAYGPYFKLFGEAHLIALGIITLIGILIIILKGRIRNKRVDNTFRYIMIITLAVNQIAYYAWLVYTDTYSLSTGAPLNLCGASIFLSIYLLATKNYRVYEVLYFWGLCGTLQSLITPDLNIYGYMHFRFYQFFIGHGLIVLVVLFMTFVHKYRPTIQSVKRAFIITNIFAVFVFLFDLTTNSNYMYLIKKPEGASLLDYLGPWPWYILILEVIAIIFFIIFYSPFLVKDHIIKEELESSKTN